MAVGRTGQPPELLPVAGVRLAAAAAGIKAVGRPDLVVLEVAEGARCAAVFTQNAFCAAPVALAKRHLHARQPRFLLINSGNANAGTGGRGMQDALACCQALAARAGCSPEEVLPFSTGVIGEPLPVERMQAGIAAAYRALSADAWRDAAAAIMTTDTVAKAVSRRVTLPGGEITITAIAKGSGMICPDMATMLAFIATDADLAPPLMERCLRHAVARSFNCITVDGDTSTNDACVLLATGAAGPSSRIEQEDSAAFGALRDAVTEVCGALAQAIVRDGEGATKFITVDVVEGVSGEECRRAAHCIANSPLVKTAFFASDPNWGRILAALGRAGVPDLDPAGVSIWLDEVCVVRRGARAEDYREAAGQAVMQRPEITVRVSLGRGGCEARVWTCDLSYEYVRINAAYRT